MIGMWQRAGRKKLPAYFTHAGAINAFDEYQDQQRKARDEAEQKLRAQRRGPTPTEQLCINLLEEPVRELDASFGDLSLRGVRYLIADTVQLLGAWQRSREYGAREI